MKFEIGDKVEWYSASHEDDDCEGTIIKTKENSALIYWWRSGDIVEYWNHYIESSMKVI